MKSLPLVLPLFALVAAFTLPPARDGVRVGVQGLFLPVTMPVRAAGQVVYERVVSPVDRFNLHDAQPKTLAEAMYANRVLQSRLSNAEAQVEDLRKALAQFGMLQTSLQRRVEAATVLGGPTDQRQTLTIATTHLSNIDENMAVVHPLGVVGKILSTAPTGGTARVLLATDPAFRVDVRFARLAPRPDGSFESTPLPMPAPLLAEGAARDQGAQGTTRSLVARYLPARPTRELLRVGDAVLLDDKEFPPATRGLRLGTIRAIDLPATDAGYASVEIEPVADLTTLREVLVVNK